MSTSGIHFKVYCVSGDNSEVKRFYVDSDAVTSFVFMKEKLRSVFSNLRGDDFRITWKDADGDYISISNDDDFITALTEMNDNPKVLYVNAEPKTFREDNPRQFQVICDVCQKGISGYRYKCIECHDYDLCATCESNGHHAEHMVLRLPNSSTPIAKLDRKMMYTAARALKKHAFTVARDAHRCARESFKAGEKEKATRHQTPGTSGQTSGYECPFATAEVGEMFAQNISPLAEMFTKSPLGEALSRGAANTTNDQDTANPNPTFADLIRSVAEAFTGLVNTEQPNSSGQAPNATPNAATPKATTNTENKEKQTEQDKSQKTQSFVQPTAPPTDNSTNAKSQEMEWTIVNDNEDSNSQASVSSQTPQTQPPPPPQDPRLMRGLAQLYEMGFSNENQFLNYMLETHDYNVGNVVKAILELK